MTPVELHDPAAALLSVCSNGVSSLDAVNIVRWYRREHNDELHANQSSFISRPLLASLHGPGRIRVS